MLTIILLPKSLGKKGVEWRPSGLVERVRSRLHWYRGKFPTLKPHLEVNNYPRTRTDTLQTTLLVHCSEGESPTPTGAWNCHCTHGQEGHEWWPFSTSTQLGNQTTALKIMDQHSGEGPGDCTGNQGPAHWWKSRGLHWQSRASTQVKVQGTALAIEGQHFGEGPGDCTGYRGPALWWRSRGLHWLSRASTLVKVQGTALELRASTPLRVQGTELAVIPHQPFQGLQLHNPLYVCTEYCI